MDLTATTAEIDKAHLAADLALKNKDLDAYMNFLSDDLEYTQINGKTIGKKQLQDDTQKYFSRIKSYAGMYDRVSSSAEGEIFVEKVVQTATVAIRVFLFFTKKWIVTREGTYKWKKINGQWKISNVQVASEKVR